MVHGSLGFGRTVLLSTPQTGGFENGQSIFGFGFQRQGETRVLELYKFVAYTATYLKPKILTPLLTVLKDFYLAEDAEERLMFNGMLKIKSIRTFDSVYIFLNALDEFVNRKDIFTIPQALWIEQLPYLHILITS